MSKESLEREKLCYDLYRQGKQYKQIVIELDDAITVNGVKQAIKRYRKRNGLKNGRNVEIVYKNNTRKRIYHVECLILD